MLSVITVCSIHDFLLSFEQDDYFTTHGKMKLWYYAILDWSLARFRQPQERCGFQTPFLRPTPFHVLAKRTSLLNEPPLVQVFCGITNVNIEREVSRLILKCIMSNTFFLISNSLDLYVYNRRSWPDRAPWRPACF